MTSKPEPASVKSPEPASVKSSGQGSSGKILGTLATAGLIAGLSACSTETSSVADRPNRPASAELPTQSTETDPAKLVIGLSTLEGLPAAKALGDGTFSRPMTAEPGTYSWKVIGQDGATIADYRPSETMAFGDPDTYTKVPGVLTFRGNHYRNGASSGRANIQARKLEIAWTHQIGDPGDAPELAGAGWMGQPLLVNWPQATKAAMGLDAKIVGNPDFVEVIYPTLDGRVYRLNLVDGTRTTDPIDAKFGFRGTGSIDPRGYPLLYVGQGINVRGDTVGYWRFRVFDLIANREIGGIPGLDPSAPRQDWGAFDSCALIDGRSDTLLEPGSNGLLYKVKLNSTFDAAAKKVGIAPTLVKVAYASPDSGRHGIVGSVAAYRNLLYAADRDGNLLCWDANTLQIVWMRNVGDATDATLVVDATADGVFLYTGNKVDARGASGGERITNLRKLDALSGRQAWQHDIPTYYDPAVNGGLLGTPVVGQGSLADLVIFNLARTTAPGEGDLLALDKLTGKPIWRRHMAHYSLSSPTLITGTDGTLYGVVPDSTGIVHLFDPQTGLDLDTLALNASTEASVSSYGSMLVVASRDRHIYGIRIT